MKTWVGVGGKEFWERESNLQREVRRISWMSLSITNISDPRDDVHDWVKWEGSWGTGSVLVMKVYCPLLWLLVTHLPTTGSSVSTCTSSAVSLSTSQRKLISDITEGEIFLLELREQNFYKVGLISETKFVRESLRKSQLKELSQQTCLGVNEWRISGHWQTEMGKGKETLTTVVSGYWVDNGLGCLLKVIWNHLERVFF